MTAQTDIAALQTAIETAIAAQFPDLQTVEFDREERDGLDVPACLLDVAEFEGEPAEDPGTEQQAAMFTFKAELILGFRTPQAKRAARVLAGAFAAFLRQRSRWPGVLQAGAIQFVRAHRSDFDPDLDKYEVWQVEWQQLLHLGETVWADSGIVPTTVFLGQAPEVGTGHEGDYTQVAP